MADRYWEGHRDGVADERGRGAPTQDAYDSACAALHRHRAALAFIADQPRQRTDGPDTRASSGDCVTEYCLPCYAGAHLGKKPDRG